jgi:uncharacterized protein CbrC (UPF0167 family)
VPALPQFRYHPDPVGTGFVVESPGRCLGCGLARGYLYTGPVFAEEELDDALCPWCIADGTAADTFDATFADVSSGVPEAVPPAVIDELSRRTVSFTGWQQEHWLYHCDDAAAFLGIVDRAGLGPYPDALDALRHEHDGLGWSPQDLEEYLASLDRDRPPSAYLFRCRHCHVHLAYSDFT